MAKNKTGKGNAIVREYSFKYGGSGGTSSSLLNGDTILTNMKTSHVYMMEERSRHTFFRIWGCGKREKDAELLWHTEEEKVRNFSVKSRFKK